MKENPIISIKELSFGYKHDQEVLSEVNCSISANTFTVIMGKNGSGKSTLLRLMGGIVPYPHGSITLKHAELKEMKARDRARIVGFLPQHHKPVFPFQVSQVVLTGRASYVQFSPKKSDEYACDKAMELTGISSLRNRIYSELSGGEQQLVMIARLLAQQPEVILLDEPISHLDYHNQMRMIKLIKELVSKKITVIAVLHDPNMAYQYGENFIYVHNKRVHEVHQDKPWEHGLVNQIFDNLLYPIEHEGKYIFIPKER